MDSKEIRGSKAMRGMQEPILGQETVSVPLTKGLFATIDYSDFHLVRGSLWYADTTYDVCYAASRFGKIILKMHMFIMCKKKIDHQDGNGLNNRRHNLRVASQSQNMMNRRISKSNNTSGFKGIYLHKHSGLWHARIHLNYKSKSLGYYHEPEEAARAYDAAAREYFGEFARLNFPSGSAVDMTDGQ